MNALMNVYATAEDAAAAESVLASMQRFGPRPSVFSYNTAIAAHARARTSVYIYHMDVLHGQPGGGGGGAASMQRAGLRLSTLQH